MGKEFLTMEDVKMRLNRTICFYECKPVYVSVEDTDTNHKITIYNLEDHGFANPKKVDYRKDNFEYKYVTLGYMQIGNKCYYLSRSPDRKNSQGLSASSIISEPNISNDLPGYKWFHSREMSNCILGLHANVEYALQVLYDGWHKVAIHRNVAIGWVDKHRIGLYYRERLVGYKNEHNNTFNVTSSREASFIQKILENIGGIV